MNKSIKKASGWICTTYTSKNIAEITQAIENHKSSFAGGAVEVGSIIKSNNVYSVRMKEEDLASTCKSGLISTVDPTYVYEISQSLFDQKMANGEFVEGVA